MAANEVHAPPKGFRKEIPVGVKFDVVIRQEGRCSACGERLGTWKETQFDHEPALQLRSFDLEARDTVPPANDPEALFAKHKDCHLAKTTGRRGESKKNAIHGDVAEIAKLRRVTEEHKAFQRRLLSKGDEEEVVAAPDKKKSRWPKRPFSSGGKRAAPASRSKARIGKFGEVQRDRRLQVLDRRQA
ncbi:hypothetical protein [Methylobacterium sp. WL120]|uniref:hypothetical protein n=1 Tax=Methylobacterium sp. WL120 TaxID=2603887 RepID=UPI0011CBD5C5|nr:hypothetical protein [Methylobacterium sp. WL120]TXM69614.1 hypothetical protein FV229_04530 [Methylobacterium sp. WL120]